uniref:Cilia- and flagella-associated protein 157 n=1 Tax=Hucho hucho TaxID=62062 RepID=A0A4W5N0G5_9TELE
DFSSQYFTVEKDMALYVKCSLAQKEDELTDVSEQLGGLQQAKDSFELQLSQLRQELQENKDKLTFENMVLAGKLEAPEESRVQKEELMARLEEQLGDLERKAVLDNDRTKFGKPCSRLRDASARGSRVPAHVGQEDARDDHNVSATAQLSQLSDKSKDLKEREKLICRELENLEPPFNKMTRKSLGNQRCVCVRVERCVKITFSQNLLNFNGTACMELGEKLEEERDVREQLETIQQAAAFTLKLHCIYVDSRLWNQMMQKLLAVLDSAALLAKGPAMKDFNPEGDSLHKDSGALSEWPSGSWSPTCLLCCCFYACY